MLVGMMALCGRRYWSYVLFVLDEVGNVVVVQW